MGEVKPEELSEVRHSSALGDLSLNHYSFTELTLVRVVTGILLQSIWEDHSDAFLLVAAQVAHCSVCLLAGRIITPH